MRIAAVATAIVLSASTASAADWIVVDDAEKDDRPMRLSALFTLDAGVRGLGFGLGGSIWFTAPIVHNGFIPALNDSFAIDGGMSFTKALNNSGYAVTPMAGVRWTFYLLEEFSAYVSIKGGLSFRVNSAGHLDFIPAGDGAVGVNYKIADSFYLNGEVGAHNFFRAGLSFTL